MISIMQPYFLPYIGYFQLIKATKKFILYDDVQYTKKGWINRNRFIDEKNKIFYFTINIKKRSEIDLIRNKTITNEWNKNRKKILNKIYFSYKNCSDFDQKFFLFEKIFLFKSDYLFPIIFNSIKLLTKYLNIDTELLVSSEIISTKSLKKEQKIFAICKELNEFNYFNPYSGVDLYSKKKFLEQKINIFFIRKKPFSYKQNTSIFYDNLSIIDIIMQNNKNDINISLDEYEII